MFSCLITFAFVSKMHKPSNKLLFGEESTFVHSHQREFIHTEGFEEWAYQAINKI